MADSDNTTALPFVIPRRRRDGCAVDVEIRSGCEQRSASPFGGLRAPLDPCVVLLQEWEAAHHMSVVLCRLQQRLETRIRNRLGFSDPSGGAGGSTAGVFEDRQRRWDELDCEVGYSRARTAEQQAVEAEEELVEAVSSTPAQSLAGVIAKLKIIVGAGQSAADMASFPWPQIQSVLTDLRTLSESGHVEQPPGDGWPCERLPGGGGHGPDDDVGRLGMSASTNKAGSGSWGRRR